MVSTYFFPFGSAPIKRFFFTVLPNVSEKLRMSTHRYTNKLHYTKPTLSVSIRECGRQSEEFCSPWTAEKREMERVGGWSGDENQWQIGNGKDGGASAMERVHYIICVPSSVFLPIRCLISVTLVQPQLTCSCWTLGNEASVYKLRNKHLAPWEW